MIAWCVILTVLLLGNIGLSVYTFLQNRRNTKAIVEVMAPLWEKHEKAILKLLGKK